MHPKPFEGNQPIWLRKPTVTVRAPEISFFLTIHLYEVESSGGGAS
jgi:hypothetical protein